MNKAVTLLVTLFLLFILATSSYAMFENTYYVIDRFNAFKAGIIGTASISLLSFTSSIYFRSQSNDYYELYQSTIAPEYAASYRSISEDNASHAKFFRNVGIISGVLSLVLFSQDFLWAGRVDRSGYSSNESETMAAAGFTADGVWFCAAYRF